MRATVAGRRSVLALVVLVLGLLVPLGIASAPPARADLAGQVATAAQYAAGRGQVGITVLDRLTGEIRDNGSLAHTQMRSASVPKMLVAESLLSRARSGAIALSDHDRALLEVMVISSDDAAMSSLYSRFGGLKMVSDVAVKYGLSEIGGPPTPGYWGMFRITSNDIVKFYAGMLGGGLHPADRDYLVGLMRRATPHGTDGYDQYFGIPRALPNQVWGIKQGWMCCQEGRRWLHTTGILGEGNRYAVAVLGSFDDGVSYAYAGDTLTGVVQRLFPDGRIPSGAELRNPRGDLNRLTEVAPGTVRTEGWTWDPDEPTRVLQVHVYVDGRYAGAGTAGVHRADVGSAFPAAGPGHGFSIDVPVTHGRHEVCAYAINVGAGDRNPPLGCRSVVVDLSPIGSLDRAAATGARTVQVAGWTLDRETPTRALDVHLYVNGRWGGQVRADQVRSDVGHAHPAAGAAHGFTAGLTLGSGGRNQVCAYGINAPGTAGANPALGCATVTLPTGVIGSVDRADAVEPGAYDLSGWTLDSSRPATATEVHVYVDGRWGGRAAADGGRSDIAAAFADAGPAHGYTARVRVPSGDHRVCVYGIALTSGTPNASLGCRTLRG